MKVLLIGAGAREHALGWKLASSPRVDELMSLPGNPGLAALGPVVEGIPESDPGAVAAMARIQRIDLVVVGPEVPLAAGVVDALARLGIPAFGPSRSAARLESSKSFAKEVMSKAGVPTGDHRSFSDPAEARKHIDSSDPPYVVKADGLAAGKGVLVTDSRSEAAAWVDRWIDQGIVVEEFLDGPEVSVFAVCTERGAVALQPARDYKRLLDGDRGPNTGGMGSYSPVDDLPPHLVATVMDEVIAPTLAEMAGMGAPFSGFLYAGLALTSEGPKVIEFNVRLGDPEAQVVLPRMTSDLVDVLEGSNPVWSDKAMVNVVLAAAGYPDSPRKGDRVTGLDGLGTDTLAFHAGTALDEKGRLVVAGGRVLSIVGGGSTIAEARGRAYEAAAIVEFRGKQFRTDIGS
jgi:phosphoribosylamine---glycine ligase